MTDSLQSAPTFKKSHKRHGTFIYHPLQVKERYNLTPRYVRIVLTGPAVENLYYENPEDDVRLVIPLDLDSIPGDLKVEFEPEYKFAYPEDAPPYEVKAYTIRRYDLENQELWLEIALHDKGHGDFWGKNAQPGQTVLVAGAWGSYVYEGTMDHLVLIGDETALPAISNTVETQPWAPAITVVAEVRDENEHLDLRAPENVDLTVHWVHRGDATPGKNDVLINGVREHITHIPNALYWGMGESSTMREIRRMLVNEMGVHRKALTMGGYWKREDDPEEWFIARDEGE